VAVAIAVGASRWLLLLVWKKLSAFRDRRPTWLWGCGAPGATSGLDALDLNQHPVNTKLTLSIMLPGTMLSGWDLRYVCDNWML
jgi:hypothetical protein